MCLYFCVAQLEAVDKHTRLDPDPVEPGLIGVKKTDGQDLAGGVMCEHVEHLVPMASRACFVEEAEGVATPVFPS